jgi:hypothetical protein
MLSHLAFSAVRLSTIFAPAHLDGCPWYAAIDPKKSGFDTEYMGGQWHEEVIDGVLFWYPACDGSKLGVAEVWAGGCVMQSAVRDKPTPGGPIIMPSWQANADAVLAALELPVRIGAGEDAVVQLACGDVVRHEYPAEWYRAYPGIQSGSVASLSFACRAPDVYHMQAAVHAEAGLLKLSIYRPDVIRANEHEPGYDECFAALFDEGTG